MLNIYDEDEFFEGYLAVRSNPYSANDVVETPTLISMLSSLEGKRVLDLGCGFGANCKRFVELGASEVVGIDISRNMLNAAERDNSDVKITYIRHDLNHLNDIKDKLGIFDVVVSSLAMHYIDDFNQLANCVYDLLSLEGMFIFSQEHPIFTAPEETAEWLEDEDGMIEGFVLKNYPDSGKRKVFWIVDGFEKYHRTFSEIINALIKSGFIIEEVLEPVPDETSIKADPQLSRCRHVPDYLFVKAHK